MGSQGHHLLVGERVVVGHDVDDPGHVAVGGADGSCEAHGSVVPLRDAQVIAALADIFELRDDILPGLDATVREFFPLSACPALVATQFAGLLLVQGTWIEGASETLLRPAIVAAVVAGVLGFGVYNTEGGPETDSDQD